MQAHRVTNPDEYEWLYALAERIFADYADYADSRSKQLREGAK